MMDKLTALMYKLFRPSGISTSLFQLMLPLALYLGFQADAHWGWWLGSVIGFTVVYSTIGNNVGFHRCITHGQFTVAKPIEYMFVWLGCMNMLGSPTSYTITHLVHHTFPDSDVDPHGPGRGIKSLLIYFQKTAHLHQVKLGFNASKRIAYLNKKYGWIHNFYVPFVVVNAFLLYLISYNVFLFLWFIPCTVVCWGIAWTVWIQHRGHAPQNSKINSYTVIYEGLHKNHHLDPMNSNNAINPGEIDYIFYLQKIFRPKFPERRNKNA